MRIERTRNTGRNILSGIIVRLFQMLMPFAMRTMLIHFMGIEYLGLSSLFSSILQVLNLAELGIGSAMVFFMYKPIAEDNRDELCALMRLYRTYYRVIGLAVAIVGLALLPFLPRLVSGAVPEELSLETLYLMNLAATVLSYWLFAYRSSVLSAHQRNDVLNYVMLGAQALQYSLQAVVLLTFRDYYLYMLVVLATQILSNIACALVSVKMYPHLKPDGTLPKEKRKTINAHIRDLFISKLGGVVLGSADTIVISAFLGLNLLVMYQNYFFIVTSVYGFLEVMLNGMLAGIGNSLAIEDAETNNRVFRRVSLLFTLLVFSCVCCFAGIFQPFMRIWMGEELMLPYGMVASFCVYFIVYAYTRLFNTFKNAAGQWHSDRFRPLVSAAVNLTLNLALVQSLQLYGILWSSIAALGVIEIPWLVHNVFRMIFTCDSSRRYARFIGRYIAAGMAAWGITTALTSLVSLSPWLSFGLCVAASALIPLSVYITCFRKRDEFKDGMEMLERMTHRRIPICRLLRIG